MVRRNRSPLAGLSDAQIKAMAAQFREALRQVDDTIRAESGGYGTAGPTHQPFRGRHRHPHYAAGHHSADSGGIHEHWHSHGAVEDGQVAEDADHDHVHDESAFGTVPPPEDPAARQSRGQYGKHVRFAGGQATVMNSARQPAPDDAWARLARMARDMQNRPGR
jgi:hypothetical protein